MTKSHYSYWLDFILGWKFEHSHGMYIFWMDNEIHLQFIEYFLFSFYYKHYGLSYVCLKWLVLNKNIWQTLKLQWIAYWVNLSC